MRKRQTAQLPTLYHITPSCDEVIASCHHRFQEVASSTHDLISLELCQEVPPSALLGGLSQESPHEDYLRAV